MTYDIILYAYVGVIATRAVLTFIQCLRHYIGTEYHYELKGMRIFENEINLDDGNYVRNLEYYLKNYECIINNKKSRKSKKNNNSDN